VAGRDPSQNQRWRTTGMEKHCVCDDGWRRGGKNELRERASATGGLS
jgi:hypothetical protein